MVGREGREGGREGGREVADEVFVVPLTAHFTLIVFDLFLVSFLPSLLPFFCLS